jgi:CelD/BcsL family acetyltransferase involved in cellulose biosynthesis
VSVDIKVRGAEKLRLMAKQLREADRVDLLRGMQKAIKAAAKPTLAAVQESARDISTKGIRKPGARHPFSGPTAPKGTRAKIAGAVVADVRLTGDEPRVRFRVAASRLPTNIRALPRKFDDGGTFRHPVMGNRDVWVSQTGDPWFWPPIRDHIKDFRAELDKAIDETRAKLEAG